MCLEACRVVGPCNHGLYFIFSFSIRFFLKNPSSDPNPGPNPKPQVRNLKPSSPIDPIISNNGRLRATILSGCLAPQAGLRASGLMSRAVDLTHGDRNGNFSKQGKPNIEPKTAIILVIGTPRKLALI